MGAGRIRGLGRASSRSTRDRVAIGSFSLLAVCLVCFAVILSSSLVFPNF